MYRRGSTLALLLFLALRPAPASAVDSAERSAARRLAQQGVEAYQAEDYDRALDRLERAYRTLPTPALALWNARALEKVGRWVEASELYLEATRIPLDSKGDRQVQEDARNEAAGAREQLVRRIPVLVVEVRGGAADLDVHVGQKAISSALVGADLPTDPGSVVVEATSEGRTVRREVKLAEGDRKVVTLDFGQGGTSSDTDEAPASTSAENGQDPPEADRGSPGGWQRPAGWIAIGLGAASLGVGTAFGIDAIAKRDASDPDCDEEDYCTGPGTELRNQGLTSAAISTATIAAGAALAAGGIVLLLTTPKHDGTRASLHVLPTLGGAGLLVRGRF